MKTFTLMDTKNAYHELEFLRSSLEQLRVQIDILCGGMAVVYGRVGDTDEIKILRHRIDQLSPVIALVMSRIRSTQKMIWTEVDKWRMN